MLHKVMYVTQSSQKKLRKPAKKMEEIEGLREGRYFSHEKNHYILKPC